MSTPNVVFSMGIEFGHHSNDSCSVYKINEEDFQDTLDEYDLTEDEGYINTGPVAYINWYAYIETDFKNPHHFCGVVVYDDTPLTIYQDDDVILMEETQTKQYCKFTNEPYECFEGYFDYSSEYSVDNFFESLFDVLQNDEDQKMCSLLKSNYRSAFISLLGDFKGKVILLRTM